MNIQSIAPKLIKNSNIPQNCSNTGIRVSIPPAALTKDTVSFSGGGSYIRRASNTISDYVARSVENDKVRMQRIAITYLDALESIAHSLKNDGFTFDRAYCEISPVKSPESYVSKISRSGTFKVPDRIRATLYLNNPYDLSNLNKLLPEMQKRGYIVADTEMKVKDLIKRGYIPTAEEIKNQNIEKLVPDLDVRLEDVSEQVTKLPPQYRYSIGKPQKSGYEDIQIRFVRDFDNASNPVLHELIVLFGPNYSSAKHLESEKVYNYLRQFSELNMKFDDNTIGSHSQKANRYIDLINQMFRGKVSQKLFLNAKNKDLYDIQDEIPINFSDIDKNLVNTYFGELRDKLLACYAERRKLAGNNPAALKELNSNMSKDKALVTKIQNGLNETIEYFNNSGVKETKNVDKK